jgi:DNA-binding PadR family transcriptional regulator
MKITTDKEELAENKVLILYVLSKINKPITNAELLDLIQSMEEMNYFYFQQFLIDLKENKYIIEYEQEKQKFYVITNSGRETIQLTIDMLPGAIKDKVDETLQEKLREIEEFETIYADFYPSKENEFMICCGIRENNKKIFEVQVYSSNRDNSIKIMENWKKNAGSIYPKMIEMITNVKKTVDKS